jgi:hypothetical protein
VHPSDGSTLPVRGVGSHPDDILSEAYDIIRGERLQHYGPPTKSFARIAGMWSAYLEVEVTSNDVCAMMVLLKQARQKDGYHRDSAVDSAGYSALQEVLAEAGADFPTTQETA